MAVFLAFDLPDRVRDVLRTAVTPLQQASRRHLSFVMPASWHITVAYLGEGVDLRPLLERDFDAPTVDLRLGHAERNVNGRVLWVTVEGIPLTFVNLARELGGLGPPDRPFRPHITLARPTGRARIHRSVPEQIAVPDVSWTATELVLFRTRDPVDGPGYRDVAVWDLG